MHFKKLLISYSLILFLQNTNCNRLKDLFNDDDDQLETLESIKSAEKVHNSKFNGISDDQFDTILKEKNSMLF